MNYDGITQQADPHSKKLFVLGHEEEMHLNYLLCTTHNDQAGAVLGQFEHHLCMFGIHFKNV